MEAVLQDVSLCIDVWQKRAVERLAHGLSQLQLTLMEILVKID